MKPFTYTIFDSRLRAVGCTQHTCFYYPAACYTSTLDAESLKNALEYSLKRMIRLRCRPKWWYFMW